MIFDIETNGLLDEATKIYCMSYCKGDKIETTTDYSDMLHLLTTSDLVIGHNICRFDIPVLEKLLGFTYRGIKIDTLSLSWYLFPSRVKHGLEDWGLEFGFPKVKVESHEWVGANMPLMIDRCETDVEINKRVWNKQRMLLNELYSQ